MSSFCVNISSFLLFGAMVVKSSSLTISKISSSLCTCIGFSSHTSLTISSDLNHFRKFL
ncbi:MAG: hypothetical protein LBC61_03170 [Candidatus Peribacteria bacterium]|nr:hypothetical protein [Candidatus Peribacteria bacterium]